MPIDYLSLNDPAPNVSSCLARLEYSGCGETFSTAEVHTFYSNCQSPLLALEELVH